MNKPTYASAMFGGYPSPDSDREAPSSAGCMKLDTSPASGRYSESCEPVSTGTRQRGNRRGKSHSPEEWGAVKADIARLYLEENRRLKDVMAILEEERGFWASQKMYKTKLTQWKFFKNNRQTDVANLLYLQQRRRAMGKESTFRRNGRDVDVAAYIRRKGLRPVDLLEVAQSGDLPPTLRCRTPPPSSPLLLPRQIQAPDDFLLQEVYMSWSLGRSPVPLRPDAHYFAAVDRYHESAAVRSAALLTHGCWLFSIGRMREGGSFCRRAFSMVDSVLRQPSRFAIYELVEVVTRYPDLEIHRKLWRYLADFASRIDGVCDRLRGVLNAFAAVSGNYGIEHHVAMMQWCRRFASKQNKGMFNGKPFDYTLLQPWDVLPKNRFFSHRYQMAHGLWDPDTILMASTYDPDRNGDQWNLRADLLLIFGNQTAWADDRISATALKMLEHVPPDGPPGYVHFVCLYALAQNNRARCQSGRAESSYDHKLAREYLRRAADVQRKAWEPGKNYYETLTLLEAWHLEAGDEEEAETTRRRRDLECQGAFENLHL